MPDYEIIRSSADVAKMTISARVKTGVTAKCGHLLSLDANGEWDLADQDGGKPTDAVALKDAAAGRMLTGCRWAELDCGAHGLQVGKTVQLSDTPGAFEISIIELAAKLETQKDWIILLSRRIKKLEESLEEPIKK